MLKVLDLINSNLENDRWKEILSAKPYCIKIKEGSDPSNPHCILNYDQIESSFMEEIVRECRGLIIRQYYTDDDGKFIYRPVCVPFFKFGNYGEGYCPEINWRTAKVYEKLDGSLIKLWYDAGKWHVSTNGTINAYQAQVNQTDLTFGQLFDKALRETLEHTFGDVLLDEHVKVWWDNLNKDCTYMFELCCPENRIVVPHTKYRLYHIGTRNNQTLQELDETLGGTLRPMQFILYDIDACLEAAKKLPHSKEGYVICDGNFNRVKVKGPAYLSVFYMKNNGVLTTERIIDILRSNEVSEFLTCFPEYTEQFQKISMEIEGTKQWLEVELEKIQKMDFPTQKDFALYIVPNMGRYKSYFFAWKKTGILPEQWLDDMSSHKLAELLENCTNWNED